MKFPLFSLMNKSLAARVGVFLVCVAAMAISISAQRTVSGPLSKSSLFAPEAIGVDIEHCANGPSSAPIPCNTSGANQGYGRGNLVPSKSHYAEGESVPIRIVMSDLVVDTEYTITIGYDYTKSGKYATDYLTTYNRTESVNNNPCVDVVGCSLAVFDTFPIPVDPEVTAGFDETAATGDDIVQIPGVFTCFGCDITAASVYTRSGDQSGDSSKAITLTFTATSTTAVLAYSSHISTRLDWGLLNSAINISGSPYHNFIVDFPGSNQGNRDLQLSATAVIFPGRVTVVKTVATDLPGFPPGTSSTFSFHFTTSANIGGAGGFNLVDNVEGAGGGSTSFSDLFFFGAANPITVTEDDYAPTWSLQGLICINDATNLPHAGSTEVLGTRTTTIVLEEGDFVTCTFHNSQLEPTAGPVTVSGQVVDSFGRGISGARLSISDAQSGATWTTLSNPFGYYTLRGPIAGGFYMMTISHKRYTFADGTRTFSLNEDIAGVDFIANP